MALKITKNIVLWEGVLVLRARQLTEGLTVAMLRATLEGCVTVIGNGLDLGDGVSSGSLYKCQGWPQHYDLDLGWL